MKYTIDKSDARAGYMQLYGQLKSDITRGVFAYGSRLPSKRLLAEEVGTSVITVEHAYSILADEGYIQPRERRGYFVIYREADFPGSERFAAAASRADAAPAARTSTAPLAHREDIPFTVMAKTMRRVILDYGEALFVPSPNAGCIELRSAIASYLRRSIGLYVTAEQIVIGSGAEHLYSMIVQLLGTDRTYAIEDPSYIKIRQVYEASGVSIDALKFCEDGIDSRALTTSAASVLHITPFCSFPSGITSSVSKRLEYIRWASERDGYIIEDNYDSELTVSRKNEDTVFSLSPDGRVIYLNTFSHTLARSIRVGYMVLSPALAETFTKKLGFYSCSVPVFEQYVIAELIESGDFERHVNRVRRKRRREGVGK